GILVCSLQSVTAIVAVCLVSGFTLFLDTMYGMSVLLTIYVDAQLGDRVPVILINPPGTPASISTTFDCYPLAKQGKAGLAMTVSAFGSAIGIFVGIILLAVIAMPLARFAREFGPAEVFALVVFGLTMMSSEEHTSELQS